MLKFLLVVLILTTGLFEQGYGPDPIHDGEAADLTTIDADSLNFNGKIVGYKDANNDGHLKVFGRNSTAVDVYNDGTYSYFDSPSDHVFINPGVGFSSYVNSNFYPWTDGSKDLGTESKQWKRVWVAELSYLAGGILIGSNTIDADSSQWLDDATHGSGSTTMWIGNETIMTSSTWNWGVMDTVITGDLVGYKVPFAITITSVSAYTDANTTTFNLEERAAATPNVAGTDVFDSDMVAVAASLDSTSFTNAGFAANTWICPTISATGDVARFGITVTYIKQ